MMIIIIVIIMIIMIITIIITRMHYLMQPERIANNNRLSYVATIIQSFTKYFRQILVFM